jgi:cytochrome c5
MKHTFIIPATLILLALSSLMISGCYYDNEDDLYQFITTGSCDTTAVSYANDVAPVFQNSCLVCHSQSAAFGNIVLEGYNNAKAVADGGKLTGSISHSNGFSAMPKGGAKLPDCTIDKIRIWVDSGAPNN